MLRASFIRVPAPGSPAWMTTAAQCLNAGFDPLVHLALGAHHGGELAFRRGAPRRR